MIFFHRVFLRKYMSSLENLIGEMNIIILISYLEISYNIFWSDSDSFAQFYSDLATFSSLYFVFLSFLDHQGRLCFSNNVKCVAFYWNMINLSRSILLEKNQSFLSMPLGISTVPRRGVELCAWFSFLVMDLVWLGFSQAASIY